MNGFPYKKNATNKNKLLLCGVIVWSRDLVCTTLKSPFHDQLLFNNSYNPEPNSLSSFFSLRLFNEICVCDGLIQNNGISIEFSLVFV